MKYRILVVSKYRWRTRLKKHEEVEKLLKTGGINAKIFTVHEDLGTPKVTNGRIDQAWFQEKLTTKAIQGDYDHVIFQFSESDGRKWKLESGIRGHNIKDNDVIGESWVCCDEYDTVTFKDGTSRNKYTKTLPHEIAHELKNRNYTTLEIHDFDYKNEINNIEGFYAKLNLMSWSKYIDEPYFSDVTQGFLEKNSIYKTGYHLGVDHGTQGKDNVQLYMPCDGRITRVLSNDTQLGNCAIILSKDERWAFRMAHMKHTPKTGNYMAGEVIGIAGNTGMSQGIHLHIDAWRDGYIKTITNVDDVKKYCVDPHTLVSENI